ncbi:Aldedh-domain-containing protein [Multifurca ochricompacta]|uniref:Aldedh-domain-containing protein n=1 Tax=Multifurca ochricompacta TaxID=376703 RepID=A0AAD4MD97_9AGAM|nr:Aldedh-domain-containing protein [Multifurca ochricompacta]
MGTLVSFLIHPFSTVRRIRDQYDEEGNLGDLIYHLTLFFAFGIYTVIRRHLNAQNRAKSFRVDPPEQADPSWSNAQTIHNARLDSHKYDASLAPPVGELSGRDYITCFDPATGLHLGTPLADNVVEIETKIDRAEVAQVKWRTSSFADRKRVVRSLKKWLVENQEVCARVACRDTGKTLIDAGLGEVLTTCSKMDWLLRHGERYLRPETRSSPLLLGYKTSQVHYEPLGVVAAIVSWNYPLHNAWSPILAALFAGNAIVIKCSEHVAWSSMWFVDVIKECLRACSFDPELVQLVCCFPDQAEALTRSPKIKHITFIGSERVGREVAIAATQHLTPVTLELGGKDPAIVLPGTDIEQWSSLWMRGIFQNAGQNCIGIERLLVHRSQYDEVYNLILSRARGLRTGAALSADGVGTGVDVGSMISRDRFQTLQDRVEAAEARGARVELGGRPHSHPYLNNGAFFEPTVIGEVRQDMDIAQHELFAPIALIMPYDTIDEAIEIANDTRYALGASVFGPDKYECLEVARRLECGMVAINDFGVFYLNQDLPFGGIKASGYGRFGGPEGLRSLTNLKTIIVDRWPWLLQTSIPRPLDYPVRSPTQAWDVASGIVDALYADGWRESWEGLQRLFTAMRRH